MKENFEITKLTKDETGQLKGGFAVRQVACPDSFGQSNGNCNGGGAFDTNTNCTGTCSKCSVG